MDSKKPKRPLGRRINGWLEEGAGEIFKDGKWRFWFLAVIGFQILNALLTAIIFGSAGNLHEFMGAILLGVGALLGWLSVGFIHYSDSNDSRLARGVSALDSLTLLFVVGHFCFLLYVYGHTGTLRSAEVEYKAETAKYNEKAEKIQADNARIAEAIRGAAEAEKQRAKLENDTAYQQRRAAEAGAPIPRSRTASSSTTSLSTSPIELEKPAPPPAESSAAFLARYDWWVRVTKFGELALAAITLIYIRNRSAKFNTGGGGGRRYIEGGSIEGFARGSSDSDPKA
jgi:hypothetical protein